MAYLGRQASKAALNSSDIPDNSITAAKIVEGTITVGDIGTDAVGTDEIATGAVDTAELADDAVTADKLANSINTAIAANTAKVSFTPDAAQVFNDTGADVDFRVEASGQANALFVQGSDGDVGIGTNAPSSALHVGDLDDGVSGGHTFQILSGGVSGSFSGNNTHFKIITDGGVEYPTTRLDAKQHMYIQHDGTWKWRFGPNGNFVAGPNGHEDPELQSGSTDDKAGMVIKSGTQPCINMGSQAAPMLQLNLQKTEGDVTYFRFNNSIKGDINITGETVAYNSFTGSHISQLSEATKSNLIRGALVKIDSVELGENSNQPKYVCSYANTENDTTVLGVLGNDYPKQIPNGDPEVGEVGHVDKFNIFALGDGMLIVTDTAGNISAGDYLSSSTRDGYAQKQSDNQLVNHTVAKSLVDVDWSAIETDASVGFKWKRIPCTYHCG